MKFLADENIAKSTLSQLRNMGYDVIHVLEAGLVGYPDEDVMALAKSEQRVIVTHDKDFGDLLRFAPKEHYGAIVLRLKAPSPEATNAVLSLFLGNITDVQLANHLIILTERGFRSRKLMPNEQ